MLVRLNTSLVWAGIGYQNEDEIDLPSDVAKALIATRQAEPLTPPIETAALITQPSKGREHARNKTTKPASRVGS